MSMTVREAVEADAEAIGRVHVRSWQVAYRGIVSDEYLDNLNVDERIDEWRRILRGEVPVGNLPFPHNAVVEVDGEVVGFLNAGAFRQEEGATPEPGMDGCEPGELWAMYVDPDHWGSGAGYALMQATMSELRSKNYNPAFLWVLTENDRARRFYERQGWVSDDVTKDFEIRGVVVSETRYSCRVEPE